MTGIVLQARTGSTRLPGKVLREICGKPMLVHILDRLKTARSAGLLAVATTVRERDDAVEAVALAEGVACFRGDENDVLDRYYRAARLYRLEHVVRATADNPFVDPEEIDRLVALHLAERADYTHAFGELPVGVGAEVFSFAALSRSWEEGTLPNHREHVNEYIQENPGRFRIVRLSVPPEKRSPALRLTVDTPEDFARSAAIYEALYRPGRPISTREAILACGA